MSFVGEGALDLYKYIDSDETLTCGLITLDLVFTVQDMCVDTYKYVKLSDGTYTFINKARTQYMMSDISGTIEYVSTYDPDIVKELTVDQYICGSMTMKDTYEFIDDIADVEEYSSVWVGQEYADMGFDYDYSISFNDKAVPLYDNQIYMYEVFSTMPISYRLDWVDVFEPIFDRWVILNHHRSNLCAVTHISSCGKSMCARPFFRSLGVGKDRRSIPLTL